jgi:hypothetical protein
MENHICGHCGKEIVSDFTYQTGYWANVKAKIHPECVRSKEHTEQSKKECQAIDSDCNDCKHFKRGEWLSKGVCSGICGKTGEYAEGRPNFYSGKECFEQR